MVSNLIITVMATANEIEMKKYLVKESKKETLRVKAQSLSTDLPAELKAEIKAWKVARKSPYSWSFYNTDAKSWENTPLNSLRIGDHWNFISNGEKHCKTNTFIINGNWTIAKWNGNVYEVLKSYERCENSIADNFELLKIRISKINSK